jgi:cell division protein ZipA
MDADTLRIILAIAGAFAIAGLYFWERRRGGSRRDDRQVVADEETGEGKREPRIGAFEGGETGADALPGEAAGSKTNRDPEQVRMDLPREPDQPGFELEPPPAPPQDTPAEFPPGPLLLSLHVVSRGEPFDGASLVHAASRCGLEPGEMEIFHCVLGEGAQRQNMFSMANMVKPGTFPFGGMAEFETPGVTLFAQLEGTPDDPGRMEEMLGTAHSLAEGLGGEIRDEKRRPFNADAERGLRERVMAFVHTRLASVDRE